MSLAAKCRHLFDPMIRYRGEDYFRRGQVSSPEVELGQVNYSVFGSSPYRVKIEWRGDGSEEPVISLDCSCPYFRGGGNCKHVWAAILSFDEDNLNFLLPKKENISQKSRSAETEKRQSHYRKVGVTPKAPTYSWESRLNSIRRQNLFRTEAKEKSQKQRTAFFLIDPSLTMQQGQLIIQFYGTESTPTGKPGNLKPMKVSEEDVDLYPDALDREVLRILLLTGGNREYGQFFRGGPQKATHTILYPELFKTLLPKLSAAEKLIWLTEDGYETFEFDDQGPFQLELLHQKIRSGYEVLGRLRRGDEIRELYEIVAILKNGFVLFQDKLALHDCGKQLGWVATLKDSAFFIPKEQSHRWVASFYEDLAPPNIHWPKELVQEEVTGEPVPLVRFSKIKEGPHQKSLYVTLSFRYGEVFVSSLDQQTARFLKSSRVILKRDREKELDALNRLKTLKLYSVESDKASDINFRVHARDFILVAREIISWGWKVEADGKIIQEPSDFRLGVSAGIDWLDLNGSVSYGTGGKIGLPALLSALKSGESTVVLDDGTLGLLPEHWLAKYSPLMTFGSESKEGFRYSKAQALLLESWLEGDSQVHFDETFTTLSQRIHRLNAPAPKEAPRSFRGDLRPYQKLGLGWLHFLNECGLGGILADDMGLGKTIQVLAHLAKKKSAKCALPSIVVVPKSLVFNWIEEAQRFVPSLRTLNFTGPDRDSTKLTSVDLVITTYATLRLELDHLRDVEFNYVILDEAQAIKNQKALTTRACKLLKGQHKLVLTGTPVENSLDDLFSLMDFVNPGLLGNSTLAKLRDVTQAGEVNRDAIDPLAKALKPLILRRAKNQVLKDLPEKVEKTLYCELSEIEREAYEELKFFFQNSVNKKIEELGLGRAKFVVLEALLRLRQAACHPGLLDSKKKSLSSTKLETLIEQIKLVIAEGHKALVFSQFTSFLDVVRTQFEAEKITYEYLDGKTNNRKERIDRFQNSPEVKTFLISLKAGGVGLNLTAADYVFILDPWWNPAAESQAIDRTHRIGQTKKVIAYRLIAKGTIEEKILELQNTKRLLADAIISADSSLLKKLTMDDIRMLME